MVIISYGTIKKYTVHNNCSKIVTDAFNNWYRVVLASDWYNINEIKQLFNTVDYVRNDRYVFNVMGNKYRVIVMIHFNVRTVYILFIGTHQEYDKIDVTKINFKK